VTLALRLLTLISVPFWSTNSPEQIANFPKKISLRKSLENSELNASSQNYDSLMNHIAYLNLSLKNLQPQNIDHRQVPFQNAKNNRFRVVFNFHIQ
jgi:hypothetical protein